MRARDTSPVPFVTKGVFRPKDFYCPLTKARFKEPVVAEDGNTYDKAAFLEWIKQYSFSPKTGAPLLSSRFRPNKALESAMLEYEQKVVPLLIEVDEKEALLIQNTELLYQQSKRESRMLENIQQNEANLRSQMKLREADWKRRMLQKEIELQGQKEQENILQKYIHMLEASLSIAGPRAAARNRDWEEQLAEEKEAHHLQMAEMEEKLLKRMQQKEDAMQREIDVLRSLVKREEQPPAVFLPKQEELRRALSEGEVKTKNFLRQQEQRPSQHNSRKPTTPQLSPSLHSPSFAFSLASSPASSPVSSPVFSPASSSQFFHNTLPHVSPGHSHKSIAGTGVTGVENDDSLNRIRVQRGFPRSFNFSISGES